MCYFSDCNLTLCSCGGYVSPYVRFYMRLVAKELDSSDVINQHHFCKTKTKTMRNGTLPSVNV